MRAVWLFACAACSFDHGTAAVPPQVDAKGPNIDAPADAAGCPGDYPLTLDGHSYKLIAAGTWDDDEAACASDAGHLVKIETMGQNEYLRQQIGTGYVWIGLSDPAMNDTLFWTDGSPLGTYNNFSGSYVSDTRNCVDMGATAGTWAVYYCTNVAPGICECP